MLSLEIGVEEGIASTHMARGAATYGGMVVGVDIIKREYSEITKLEREDYNYLFVPGSSLYDTTKLRIQKLANYYGGIGLVYQDSSHHYQASKDEWEFYSELCKEGAIWICDDITPSFHDSNIDPPGKGMVQYFEEIPVSSEHKKLYPNVLHYGNTQGIILL